ncbi:putative transmembrane protein 244 [Pyxicephalus adspersus]|uniref:putative transmembrane protein 244 n=1 Tax=Pyxicephalus adspersus TaxID=30357 RepID=UPI003B5D026F
MDVRIRTKRSSMNIYFYILLCLLIFYTVFYIASTVCAGFLRIENYDWSMPFRHTILPSLNSSEYLVQVIPAEVTFLLSGLLFVPVVGSMVWDYSTTVSFLHVIICYIVTQEFPVMWQWWLQIGCGLLLMITSGQTLAYFACRNTYQRHRTTLQY